MLPRPAPCRFCAAPLRDTFADLGDAPLANAYPAAGSPERAEPRYPLHAFVCAQCGLVQLGESRDPRTLFCDYAYFSSFSDTWLEHARAYADMACRRFALGPATTVVEIGSNDGCLLRHFVERRIPALGVEPAANVARTAIAAGVPTRVAFFGRETARGLVAEGTRARLLIGNNVLAHVPDLLDFLAGVRIVLAPGGVATFEFPHLMRLIDETQYDTIYHEHFSYFSFTTARRIFAAHGLRLFDVEELPTHGGSLRIYACARAEHRPVHGRVSSLLAREATAGLTGLERYRAFGAQVQRVRRQLRSFLERARRDGRSVAGYGAPAKGSALLNGCGVGPDLLAYTVDRNPRKQGRFLPGTRVPVFAPDRIIETKPDYVLILPWNLRDEIVGQMAAVRRWGGRFVVPIPALEVCP